MKAPWESPRADHRSRDRRSFVSRSRPGRVPAGVARRRGRPRGRHSPADHRATASRRPVRSARGPCYANICGRRNEATPPDVKKNTGVDLSSPPRSLCTLALTAPRSISTGMSDPQSQLYAAIEEAQRVDQKKREAAEALRARQHEYETANLRGRQQQIKRTRAALEAAQAAYEAAERDMQRRDDKAEEIVQAQVRAAYM
jgi:hypothetical protein